ncbi:MAG: 3-deoxy-7-phosphoheptulonate synthase [Spirochaetaceae bacterium]|nr:MAG: 3-deoxy-7-phosphoheptulonate synthase [Spirochaetaceae bacterium]
MIVVLEHNIKPTDKSNIVHFLEDKGFRIREIQGEEETILGAVGIIPIDLREVELLPGVARVIPITKPYKLASREFKKEDTSIPVGSVKIGGSRVAVIAGPCSVESRQQIMEIAALVRESGAVILRGGAYKARTSPYAFQGLGEEGLKYLKEAGDANGMPVISEIVTPEHAGMFAEYADILQVGARNMQNFELLKRVGALHKPVLLKRGPAATIQDLLMSAEYLLAHGTNYVMLCERGIRTFETYTRNTLDISAIPVVKKLSHLPILVDPSHGTGIRAKVLPMALAAVAAGADGLIVEVHTDPDHALSDGPQSLYPEQFEKLMRDIQALTPVLSKELARLPETLSPPPAYSPTVSADQGQILVAFQGEPGAFSENALLRYFPDSAQSQPLQEFRDVFDSVLTGKSHYGIIPIENTLTGSIHQNYDLLLQYPDIRIVGEKTIRIIHNLIGVPGARIKDIKRVYSHPQGLSQCARYLDSYPQWEKIPYYDTAGSIAFVAREGNKENAGIASLDAARVHKMNVLKEGIETDSQNYTRFVIIAREELAQAQNRTGKANRASLVFSTANTPGSLFRALQVLADRNINMVKLESRPIAGKPWEEMFYVDVDIPEEKESFQKALEELSGVTETLRILGLYTVK